MSLQQHGSLIHPLTISIHVLRGMYSYRPELSVQLDEVLLLRQDTPNAEHHMMPKLMTLGCRLGLAEFTNGSGRGGVYPG